MTEEKRWCTYPVRAFGEFTDCHKVAVSRRSVGPRCAQHDFGRGIQAALAVAVRGPR
jgi:hypothetical protein